MLIDFTVENYRSIKDPVTLSAIEATRGPGRARQGTGNGRRIKTDAEIAPAYPVPGRDFALLPVLGIFGANASGKTNVLRALDDLLLLLTADAPPPEPLIPFELHAASSASPTNFRLRVALGGAVYTYSVRVQRQRVLQETLEHLPVGEGESATVFSREFDATTAKPRWHIHEGIAGLIGREPKGVQSDGPWMSKLSRYRRDPLVGPLAKWICESVRGISRVDDAHLEREIARYWVERQELSRDAFLAFLRTFDLSIIDLTVRPGSEGTGSEVWVSHEAAHGRVDWPMEHESLGTRRLFELTPKLLWTLEHGTLALIDELGSNFHPYLTDRIVRLFQSPDTNPKRAQLVFTSHDNTLLQNQLLRRDQVLFTEKRADGSTDLYSVSDFRARNDLALDKAYLDGRFGAVPVLPTEEEMLAVAGRAE